MTGVQATCTVDSSELQHAIPRLMAFGRRTLRQQCVTSMAFICLDAQELTPAVSVARIDSELDEEITLQRGKTGAQTLTHGQWTVLARMNPDSAYNKSTGGRWAIKRPEMSADKFQRAYGDGGMARRVFWEVVNGIEERQKKARHSSTHFLQHGWSPAIKKLLTDPDYFPKGGGKAARAQSAVNSMNSMDIGLLGGVAIISVGDTVRVVAQNDVGDVAGKSNSVLAAKHRAALIEYGAQPLQAAVEREAVVMNEQIERNLALGFKQDFGNL